MSIEICRYIDVEDIIYELSTAERREVYNELKGDFEEPAAETEFDIKSLDDELRFEIVKTLYKKLTSEQLTEIEKTYL